MLVFMKYTKTAVYCIVILTVINKLQIHFVKRIVLWYYICIIKLFILQNMNDFQSLNDFYIIPAYNVLYESTVHVNKVSHYYYHRTLCTCFKIIFKM